MSGKHSRHTVDTSLDLNYSMPSALKQLPANGIVKKSHIRGKSSGTTVSSARGSGKHRSQRSQARSPFAEPPDANDYLTSTTDGSDIESYIEKRRRRRHDDEDLIFKEDGYGQAGGGLPGLFDNGDTGPTTPTWASSLTTNGHKKHTSRARPPTSVPRIPESTASRHLPPDSLRAWEYDDDDTSSLTVSESDPDVRSRNGSSAAAQLGSILSGDGPYDPEEEAMEENLDARLAMRLRKEMKRRERTSTRRQTLQARVIQESYEQGHVADTEA